MDPRRALLSPNSEAFIFSFTIISMIQRSFPGGASGKEPAWQCGEHKRCGFDSWVRKIPWRRARQPTPVFLSGESHGQRSLVGYGPESQTVGHNWSDLAHTHRCSVVVFSKCPQQNLLGVLVKSAEYQAPCPNLLGAQPWGWGKGFAFLLFRPYVDSCTQKIWEQQTASLLNFFILLFAKTASMIWVSSVV